MIARMVKIAMPDALKQTAPLLRRKCDEVDKTEGEKCHYQNDDKENNAAIFETLTTRCFNVIEQPVGRQVKASGHQSVVDDFQVYSPS